MRGEEEKAQNDGNASSKNDYDPDDRGDVALRIKDALLAGLKQPCDLIYGFAEEDAVLLALWVRDSTGQPAFFAGPRGSPYFQD